MTRRHTNRGIAVAAAGAVLALGLGACSAADPGGAAAPTDETITVLHAAIGYEPLFIAQEQGFFEDRGLNVELRRGGAPQDSLGELIGGSADIITTAWDSMVQSTAEDIPVRVIAGNSVVSDEVDTSGVVVRADAGLNALADLAGKTVAFDSLGAGGTVEFTAALQQAGVAADQVELVAIPYASMQASLENGQVDAAFPSDPFYSQMTAAEGNVVIANPVRETRAGVPITLFASSDDWLAANGEQATAFLEAVQAGIDFYADPANLANVQAIRATVTQTELAEVSDRLPTMRLPIDVPACEIAAQQLQDVKGVEPKPIDDILWQDAPRD